jgi:mannose-6-phosphate isomerase-like protein (cupin superfamily)
MKPECSTIDCANAQHYVWGGVCDGWRYVDEADMSVIIERNPSGASEQTNRHHNVRQLFYVLDGQASLEVDGAVVRFGPGQAVHVPPGTTHRFFNSSPGDTRILVISSGPARNDREDVDLDPVPDLP